MRKLLVLAISAVAVLGLMGSASASTTITWTGQGSSNLPCTSGGHWVLTGKGITSATATIGGQTYTMVQSGAGSFSVDSTGSITTSTSASASYEGWAKNPQFVLSHCNGGGYGDPYA